MVETKVIVDFFKMLNESNLNYVLIKNDDNILPNYLESENDIDFPVASALASEIVSEKAFEPVSAETFDKAMKIIEKCRKVISCTERFGTLDSANKKLYDYAHENNWLV